MKYNIPDMKLAGQMVSIDLENPIDLSQMTIMEISETPKHDIDSRMMFERKTILHAFVNNNGREEELEITFILKSQNRSPKN